MAANPLEEKRKIYLDALVSRDRPSFCRSSIRIAGDASSFCIGNNGKNLIGGNGIDGT
jgi:hypothetical protein